VLLAAAEDWGWTTAAGARLSDTAAPDPLLAAWLAEQRGSIFHDELRVPSDLSPLLAGILSHHGARALIPVVSHDDLLAVVLLPTDTRRLSGRARTFIDSVADRLAEALVHARMAQQAASRANVAREVELAATVQAQLLPNKGPHQHGDLTVVGSWLPATRCAGDFWGVYPLEQGRVLVAIGDVTGHGVASAMVTAAATAACDVIVRRHMRDLDLGGFVSSLDAAIRKVGGGDLSMTCFATILDPEHKKLSYVSCGHTTPYVCRHGERGVGITALVGRGNPLGTGLLKPPKISERTLDAGDLIVWYTDGLIDAQSPQGEAFGDRRLQHMLKRLDRASLAAVAVHDVIHAGIAAHRGGRPRNDDETLVVAQWAPPLAGSIDSASAISKE
jgi:serine phosphatase RsbU (regulator of sigma subunit)